MLARVFISQEGSILFLIYLSWFRKSRGKGRGRGRGRNDDDNNTFDENEKSNREKRIDSLGPRLRDKAREKMESQERSKGQRDSESQNYENDQYEDELTNGNYYENLFIMKLFYTIFYLIIRLFKKE